MGGLPFGLESLRTDGGGDGALLVTAHPDDETVFFSPAVLALRNAITLHVLCLSTGDYDGLGKRRSSELCSACEVLGVRAERVTVVDDARLQDGPREHWSAEHVAAIVGGALDRTGLRRVITFDELGVTGHANHVAVQRGVRQLLLRGAGDAPASPPRVRVYALHSVGLLRHYLGWFDVPITLLAALLLALLQRLLGLRGRRAVCCVSLAPWVCHMAMRAHGSQYVWFRRLNVLFSRYVHVNTLVEVLDPEGDLASQQPPTRPKRT